MGLCILGEEVFDRVALWTYNNFPSKQEVGLEKVKEMILEDMRFFQAMNVNSVNFRHKAAHSPKPYWFDFNPGETKQLSTIQFIALIKAIEFQSCWCDNSEFTKKIVRYLVLGATKFPGWGSIPSIPDNRGLRRSLAAFVEYNTSAENECDRLECNSTDPFTELAPIQFIELASKFAQDPSVQNEELCGWVFDQIICATSLLPGYSEAYKDAW